MAMHIEQAKLEQLPLLLSLYEEARAFMAANGNPTQWEPGYPGAKLLEQDLHAGHQYVCIEDGSVLATFYYAPEEDPTYAEIFDGSWIKDGPYGVMHRICVTSHGCGVGRFCLDWCFDQCKNLRADTHQDNLPMQKLLQKCGFFPCGTIFIEDGSSRLAYQRI